MTELTFEEIYESAVDRKGEEALRDRMPEPLSSDELAEVPDDRFLAAMARAAFSAGFKWRIVDAMWDGFETLFCGFDPFEVAAMDESDVERLGSDTRIVRNKIKIWATIQNARFMCRVIDEHGSFAGHVADWPLEETVELWEFLADGGSHLGGNTGPRALRHVGRDTFILTLDVAHALKSHGIMTYSRTSKTGRRQAQDAFLEWHAQSGRPFAQISMILACAFDRPDEL